MEQSLEVIREVIETTINSTIENANLLVFDKFSLGISIIAIVISIWTVFRNESIQFKNKFYDKILQNPLQDDLPKLINEAINVERSDINEESCTKLEEYIGEFRQRILVFKYNDERFYRKIDKVLVDIDEQLVVMVNRNKNFSKKYSEFLNLVKKLYKLSKKYIA